MVTDLPHILYCMMYYLVLLCMCCILSSWLSFPYLVEFCTGSVYDYFLGLVLPHGHTYSPRVFFPCTILISCTG